MTQLLSRLEEEYKKLSDQLKQQEEVSFSIECSIYKVNLIMLRYKYGAINYTS